MTSSKTKAHGQSDQPSQPDRLDGQSLDLRDQRLAALKALLPEAFDLDGNLVQDKLLEALKPASYDAADDIPTFGLGWPGKQQAFAAAGVPTTATLRPCPDQSVDFDTTGNLLIQGDNLEVLKTLQRAYHGKVKMIYIDPPYNTGKDFVYPDNYSQGLNTYLKRTQQKDDDGFWKSTNSETTGRKHANWLSMMTPRLTLARNLLRDDGVIFISIDDNEVASLRLLCDEVFGAENFLGIFIINSSPSAIDYGHIAKSHEYALFYAKHFEAACTNHIEDDEKIFKYSDSKGGFNLYPLYNGNVAFNPKTRPNLFYPFYLNENVTDENGFYEISVDKQSGWVEVLPVISRKDGIQRVWRWGKRKARENINVEIVGYRSESGEYRIVQKTRLTGKLIRSLQLEKNVSSRKGTAEIDNLFGRKVFSFPKPTGLLRNLIQSGSDNDSIILDFFAGSGTTGHAVMAQNAADGGNRRYICVQLPEPLDEPVTLDDGVVCETIFDLTRERLKRAGKKIADEQAKNLFQSPSATSVAKNDATENTEDTQDTQNTEATPKQGGKTDTGMRVFKLDSSNFIAWNGDPAVSEASLLDQLDQLAAHTVPGRSEMDILWEILLKMGLTLDLRLERFELAGASFIGVNDRTRVISTQTSIPMAAFEALLDQGVPPSDLVVLDCAFETDTARANIATLYKQRKDEDGRPVCHLKVV